MREAVKDYLNFSKKERTGIFILLSIIAAFSVAPVFYDSANNKYGDTAALHSFRDKIVMLEQQANSRYNKRDKNGDGTYAGDSLDDHRTPGKYDRAGQRFGGLQGTGSNTEVTRKAVMRLFDPNTISVSEWIQLGVNERTAATIDRYRSKGGKFRNPEDILKIFGLSESDKKRLLPYVNIPAPEETARPAGLPAVSTAPPPATALFKRKILHEIDINSADTSEWTSLPGIGAVLSQRITRYRDKLGGFYSADQVGEVYGLADSTFKKIRPFLHCVPMIRKININGATPELLEQHPYFRRQLARAIVDYRVQHGSFKDLSDLKQLVAVTAEIYERMSPYLEL